MYFFLLELRIYKLPHNRLLIESINSNRSLHLNTSTQWVEFPNWLISTDYIQIYILNYQRCLSKITVSKTLSIKKFSNESDVARYLKSNINHSHNASFITIDVYCKWSEYCMFFGRLWSISFRYYGFHFDQSLKVTFISEMDKCVLCYFLIFIQRLAIETFKFQYFKSSDNEERVTFLNMAFSTTFWDSECNDT